MAGRPRKDKPPCACGAASVAVGKCWACYYRDRRDRNPLALAPMPVLKCWVCGLPATVKSLCGTCADREQDHMARYRKRLRAWKRKQVSNAKG